MENKKYLPLKIVHSILLVAVLVLCIIAFAMNNKDTSVYGNNIVTIIASVFNIIALIFGAIYMLMGYTKKAAPFYKLFALALMVTSVFQIALIMSNVIYPLFNSFLYLISLVGTTVLVIAKDLGKVKTYITVFVLLICRLILVLLVVVGLSNLGSASIGVLSAVVSDLLLAGTAAIMATGKYLDKAERGTK